ncbi:hypothetical protein NMG60_11014468 [Bertholletia excelsa]
MQKEAKPSPPDSSRGSSDPVTRLIQGMFSYDGNVMLFAVVSLLLVILFVLLLHVYAQCLLSNPRRRTRSSGTAVQTTSLTRTRTRRSNAPTSQPNILDSLTDGLETSAIASIPLFVYESNRHKQGLECVICLSVFEEGELGRRLPKCGHGFHMDCIDVWLQRHSSCPICRAPAATAPEGKQVEAGNRELVSEDAAAEVVIEVSSSGESENRSDNGIAAASSSSPAGSSSAGSLKRVLSRSRSERKVHPSCDVDESGH